MFLAELTAVDIGTASVAAYAALIATLAFAFNVLSWLRTWQTRLCVRVRAMNRISMNGATERVVLFHITNQSGHVVKVTHVGMDPIARGGPHIFIPHPMGLVVAGPFEVPPRDSVDVWITPDRLDDGDPRHKTRASIATSDGKSFRSKRVRVSELR